MFNFDKDPSFFLFTIFSFLYFAFDVISKKSLPYPRSWRFSFVFPPESFIVLCFIFGSMIHFKLILSFFCIWRSSLFTVPFVETTTFLLLNCCQKFKSQLMIFMCTRKFLGFFLLFHWSKSLSFHQCHTVLTTIAYWYILKFGCVHPPTLFFFKIVLAIVVPLSFHIHFRIS